MTKTTKKPRQTGVKVRMPLERLLAETRLARTSDTWDPASDIDGLIKALRLPLEYLLDSYPLVIGEPDAISIVARCLSYLIVQLEDTHGHPVVDQH